MMPDEPWPAAVATAPVLLHVFPSFATGGAQVRMIALANRFGPRWRHLIVALNGEVDAAARLAADVPFRVQPVPFRPGAGPWARLAGIAGLLRRLRPAVLITSNWGSMEWAIANRAIRRPHLHTEDGFGPEERVRQLPRRVLARALTLRRSTILLPSATLERVALRQWRLPPGRLHRVANGIDLGRFRPGPSVPLMPGEGPLIGTTAALRPEKNIGRLLRAVAILRAEGIACRLAILGDGPERGRLEAQAAGLGDACRFLGHVSDPSAACRAMDIVALSSDTEQMPFAVLEAMATGLPVASTDVGDVAAMLAPENRPHVVPLDDAALAGALRSLLLRPELRAAIGAANRRKAERDYDQEAMFQSLARLTDGLIGR